MLSMTVVVERVRRVLDVEPTPFATGLQETYHWHSGRERRQLDFFFEDALINEAAAA